MKVFKINIILALLFSVLGFVSCIQDDNFNTPNLSFKEPEISANQLRTLSSLAGDLAQEQDNGGALDYTDQSTTVSYTFNENDEYINGYVISSDEAGNYFEELIIQDNYENPTIGIKLLIDINPLFTKYEVGRKVFIKINGLSVGISNGVLAIGTLNGTRLDQIPSSVETQIIQRSNEVAMIMPLTLPILEFSSDKTNIMIRLTEVQFNRDEVINDSFTFASEQFDEFNGERILESCTSDVSAILSTSTFSDFKGLNLPTGSGTMDAILTKNFFGEVFNLSINTPEDIVFTNSERCDPTELSCGLAVTIGMTSLFEDDFEGQSTNTLISGNGWTNYIEEGSEGWEAYTQTGTNASQGISARIGSGNSGDASTIAWLITPQIDLEAHNNTTLNFQTSNSFSDSSTLKVLFSNDWDGTENNIVFANWGIVSDAYITQNDDFFGQWFESGNVDLSCESGQVYFAFKYIGNGQDIFNGTYELDAVSINAQ